MSIVETAVELSRSGRRVEAGALLCGGLMAHDSTDPFRQGYTLGNALIAAAEWLSLSTNEVAAVADSLVQHLVAKAQAVSEQFTAANEDGTTVDWYDNEGLYPAIADLRAELVEFGQPMPKNAFTA